MKDFTPETHENPGPGKPHSHSDKALSEDQGHRFSGKNASLTSVDEHLSDIEMGHASKPVVLKLCWASMICFIIMISEAAGGFFAQSLALLTDSAHMFSDLSGFIISIFALRLAKKPPTSKFSFGFLRAEIIGAIGSIMLIWIVTFLLVVEAIERIIDLEFEIDEDLMLITSVFGLICNLIIAKILYSGGNDHGHHLHGHHLHGHEHHLEHEHHEGHQSEHHSDTEGHHRECTLQGENHCKTKDEECAEEKFAHKHDRKDEKYHELAEEIEGKNELKNSNANSGNEKKKNKNLSVVTDKDNVNIRAAMMHIIGDIAQSIGVIIAALIIFFKPEYKVVDPICTFVFAILVLGTTYNVTKDCLKVIMEGVPDGIHLQEFEEELRMLEDVIEVHDLHIWQLTVGKPALSAHVISSKPEDALNRSLKLCRKYGIYHSTIQVENKREGKESSPLACKQNIHLKTRIDDH